jgi:hypothetical protein
LQRGLLLRPSHLEERLPLGLFDGRLRHRLEVGGIEGGLEVLILHLLF